MSSVRAVSDTEYSEGDDNSGRGLSAREEGITTSVGDPGSADPGSGSAYFYWDPDPQIRDLDPRIFKGFQIRDPRSARKTVRISNTGAMVGQGHNFMIEERLLIFFFLKYYLQQQILIW